MVPTNTAMSTFMKVVFWFVAANALAGGLALVLFPHATDRLFFWTITPPINARLFGVLYLSGAATVAGLTRRGQWEAARFLIPVLVAAGALISLVTLLHLDRFTAGLPLLYWSGIYVGAPLVAIALYVRHERRGGNWVVNVPVRSSTRRLALIGGGVTLVAGLLILGAPMAFVAWWPWPVSALMLRIFAAWFSAFGVGLLWFHLERDWERLAPLATLMIAAAGADLLMLVVHRDELTTTGVRLWLYAGHLTGFGLLGLLMHWLQRRSQSPQAITLLRHS